MKFTIKVAVLGLFAVSTLTSCVSNKKYNELLEEKEALAKSLAETQENLKMLEEEKDQLMQEKDNLANEVESMKADLEATKAEIDQVKQMIAAKDAEIAKIKGDVEAAFSAYEEAGLTITEENDMIYVSMPEKVLFRSGSARLDSEDKKIIGQLAEILKKDPNLSVIVEGHTDDVPIAAGPYS
ncbi:MAG: OmpA family protein, partial [Phaeodactylibacter sp.]|nr:OmpA family protein [Phaeodactylibacter sp.]